MKYTARAPSNARVKAAESVWSATNGSAPKAAIFASRSLLRPTARTFSPLLNKRFRNN